MSDTKVKGPDPDEFGRLLAEELFAAIGDDPDLVEAVIAAMTEGGGGDGV